jgi:hypothetical protein
MATIQRSGMSVAHRSRNRNWPVQRRRARLCCRIPLRERTIVMKLYHLATGTLAAALLTGPALAGNFTLQFQWGDIPLCTTGHPNTVASPTFEVDSVPAGTARIRFELVDLDVPQYPHGGGTVAYAGGDRIPGGAFTYRSPCPPGGRHSYRWTATALDDTGKALGEARAERDYPE